MDCSHPLAIRVVEGLQLHDIWVPDNPHNLQFPVLASGLAMPFFTWGSLAANLEPLVLQHALDRGVFA